jgi:hypothetical protein
MVCQKNQWIKFYQMHDLNQTRKLLSKAIALLDQKQLLMAIASGENSGINCLISIGLHYKEGARGLLALYMAAAERVYHPKSLQKRRI